MSANQAQSYQNVMELIVAKEIERQLRMLPSSLVNYIDRGEVATYALNRLPPLYASSLKGKEQQTKRAETEYKEQIATAVRQALVAIQRDPLRQSIPLITEGDIDYQAAIAALQELQDWLKKLGLLDVPKLSWDNMPKVVKRAFYKAARPGFGESQNNEVNPEYRPDNRRWNQGRYR
jgi:hypothetical protein